MYTIKKKRQYDADYSILMVRKKITKKKYKTKKKQKPRFYFAFRRKEYFLFSIVFNLLLFKIKRSLKDYLICVFAERGNSFELFRLLVEFVSLTRAVLQTQI